MTLREQFEANGNYLFRWRSYLPVVMLVPMVLTMWHFQWPRHSHALQEVWTSICLAVSLVGLLVRVWTVGYVPAHTSGRNSKEQIAEHLNTTGMYSVVRHPLYVGNLMIWLGISMFCLEWTLVVIFCLCFWVYYERIMFAEEEFLRREFGEAFVEWAARTPAFVPRFSNWKPPELPFSLRTVLRREYAAVFGISLAYFSLEFSEHLIIEHRIAIEPFWLVFGIVGIIVSFGLRFLKKETQVLNVAGR